MKEMVSRRRTWTPISAEEVHQCGRTVQAPYLDFNLFGKAPLEPKLYQHQPQIKTKWITKSTTNKTDSKQS